MNKIMNINGKSYRLATLTEIASGKAFWSGQHFLVQISDNN